MALAGRVGAVEVEEAEPLVEDLAIGRVGRGGAERGEELLGRLGEGEVEVVGEKAVDRIGLAEAAVGGASAAEAEPAPGLEAEMAAKAGDLRLGVASGYLAGLAPGSRIHVAVKPAHRQLPLGFDGPLLLIGAGTGLSQLYGVLEDRALRGIAGRPGSPVRLFFGCRSEPEFLLRDRLLVWRDMGVLDSIAVVRARPRPTSRTPSRPTRAPSSTCSPIPTPG